MSLSLCVTIITLLFNHQLVVETLPAADVPHPPPLEEGLEEAIFLRHLATPPSSPAPDKDADGEEAKETDGDGATGGDDAEAAGV